MNHSEALDQLAAALAKAQSQVLGAKKDSANPFYRSTYADLASVWEACREALTGNGLSVVQFPGYDGSVTPPVATVTTYLLHSSGQWMCGTAGAPLPTGQDKEGRERRPDAQTTTAAVTYLRRTALAAVAAVAPEDDDGNTASGRGKEPPPRKTYSSTGPSEPSKRAPMPPLDQPPPALAAKEPMPWEPPTDTTPCPHTKEGKSIATMTRAELAKLQAWLMTHPEAEAAEEWGALVKLAIAKRAA